MNRTAGAQSTKPKAGRARAGQVKHGRTLKSHWAGSHELPDPVRDVTHIPQCPVDLVAFHPWVCLQGDEIESGLEKVSSVRDIGKQRPALPESSWLTAAARAVMRKVLQSFAISKARCQRDLASVRLVISSSRKAQRHSLAVLTMPAEWQRHTPYRPRILQQLLPRVPHKAVAEVSEIEAR